MQNKKQRRRRRVYGPVSSRRFGLSLGLDLVPAKTCTYDCTYCQVGVTTDLTCEGFEHYPLEDILDDLEYALDTGPAPDVITFAGSGEPTLFEPFDELVRELRRRTTIPLLLITNGSLLHRERIRLAARDINILVPSIDAGNETTWRLLNRPAVGISYDQMVNGIRLAAEDHPGTVRIEVMLVRDVNDDPGNIEDLARTLESIPCDGIDVNTPVRPGRTPGDLRLTVEELEAAARLFGPRASVVAPRANLQGSREAGSGLLAEQIFETTMRRPCTARDLETALGRSPHEISKALEILLSENRIKTRSSGIEVYFSATN